MFLIRTLKRYPLEKLSARTSRVIPRQGRFLYRQNYAMGKTSDIISYVITPALVALRATVWWRAARKWA